MSVDWEPDEARVRRTAAAIDNVVAMIPSHLYAGGDDDEAGAGTKYWQHKKGRLSDKSFAEKKKKAKAARRANLSPTAGGAGEGAAGAGVGEGEAATGTLKERLAAKLERVRGARENSKRRARGKKGNKAGKAKGTKRKPEATATATDAAAAHAPAHAHRKRAGGDGDGEDGGMQFSRVQFGDKAGMEALERNRKKKKLNKHELLAKAEAREARLKALEGTAQGEAEAKSASWRSALNKAHGTKVRDNAALLRKSIKRDEKKKERSRKRWADRLESASAEKDAEQAARDEKKARRLAAKRGVDFDSTPAGKAAAAAKAAEQGKDAGKLTRKERKAEMKAARKRFVKRQDAKDARKKGGKGGKGDGAGKRPGFEGRKRSFLNK